LSDIDEIRARARKKIEEGAVTDDYTLDREQVVGILNEALATELICTLRYRFHNIMATGIHAESIAEEFREHAEDEEEHAWRIARRIKQLGGKPEMNPSVFARTSHSEYVEGSTLTDMIRENLVAERIAIQTYREIVRFLGDRDSTSRTMMEEILAKEEEHADDMSDLLTDIERQ
jgi:bacterioferritin